jgi:hypothetical protein
LTERCAADHALLGCDLDNQRPAANLTAGAPEEGYATGQLIPSRNGGSGVLQQWSRNRLDEELLHVVVRDSRGEDARRSAGMIDRVGVRSLQEQ